MSEKIQTRKQLAATGIVEADLIKNTEYLSRPLQFDRHSTTERVSCRFPLNNPKYPFNGANQNGVLCKSLDDFEGTFAQEYAGENNLWIGYSVAGGDEQVYLSNFDMISIICDDYSNKELFYGHVYFDKHEWSGPQTLDFENSSIIYVPCFNSDTYSIYTPSLTGVTSHNFKIVDQDSHEISWLHPYEIKGDERCGRDVAGPRISAQPKDLIDITDLQIAWKSGKTTGTSSTIRISGTHSYQQQGGLSIKIFVWYKDRSNIQHSLKSWDVPLTNTSFILNGNVKISSEDGISEDANAIIIEKRITYNNRNYTYKEFDTASNVVNIILDVNQFITSMGRSFIDYGEGRQTIDGVNRQEVKTYSVKYGSNVVFGELTATVGILVCPGCIKLTSPKSIDLWTTYDSPKAYNQLPIGINHIVESGGTITSLPVTTNDVCNVIAEASDLDSNEIILIDNIADRINTTNPADLELSVTKVSPPSRVLAIKSKSISEYNNQISSGSNTYYIDRGFIASISLSEAQTTPLSYKLSILGVNKSIFYFTLSITDK